jgi:hypothetical protein
MAQEGLFYQRRWWWWWWWWGWGWGWCHVLLVPQNSSHGRGVITSLTELGEQSYQLTSARLIPVWNVASWSVVRCIVHCVVSVVSVFHSGSSFERHHSKCTASRDPQQRLPFRTAKVTRQ